MKDAIIKLLKVKTIVTLILTVVFAILSIKGVIDAQQFLTIFSTIIGFYFGTQHEKNNINAEDNQPENKNETIE